MKKLKKQFLSYPYSILWVILVILFIITLISISSYFYHHKVQNSSQKLHNISDITEMEFAFIDLESSSVIQKQMNNTGDFQLKTIPNRKKSYFLVNEKENYLICIYQVQYVGEENSYTFYAPVQYHKIKKEEKKVILGEGNLLGEELYFTLDHSAFGIGYYDLDTFYKKEIKKQEEEFTITKK